MTDPIQKKAKKKKAKETTAKKQLAYDNTIEELDEVEAAKVKCHFARKPPPLPKHKCSKKIIDHFHAFLEVPPSYVFNRPSDYCHFFRILDKNKWRSRDLHIVKKRENSSPARRTGNAIDPTAQGDE